MEAKLETRLKESEKFAQEKEEATRREYEILFEARMTELNTRVQEREEARQKEFDMMLRHLLVCIIYCDKSSYLE
jgi:Skp family chaperone for outer membrane proteins